MKSHSDATQNESTPTLGEASVHPNDLPNASKDIPFEASVEGSGAAPQSSSPTTAAEDLVPPPVNQKVPDDAEAFEITITAFVEAQPQIAVDSESSSKPEPSATHVLALTLDPEIFPSDSERETSVTSPSSLSSENPAQVETPTDFTAAESQEVQPNTGFTSTPPSTSISTSFQAAPTLPQQAMSFALPDAKIFAETSHTETSSLLNSRTVNPLGERIGVELTSAMITDDLTRSNELSPSSPRPPAESLGPMASHTGTFPTVPQSAAASSHAPRSRKARLAFAALTTALVVSFAVLINDPRFSPGQLLPRQTEGPELVDREPTLYDWICQRPKPATPGEVSALSFVSHQKSDTTEWKDADWKTQDTSASASEAQVEIAEFKAQAGDRVQVGEVQCEVIAYGSRSQVRPQQLVQLPQLLSPATQARFFASVQNPSPIAPTQASELQSHTQHSIEGTRAANTSPTNEFGGDSGGDPGGDFENVSHPLALSLPFVEVAQKFSDASRVIENQFILTENDLDLRYEPSFDTADGEVPAPSLSLSRYRFEWSPTPQFIETEIRRLEPTSDGRFSPPSLPLGDSYVRVVDLLAQATGPISQLRVLEPPLRFETSTEADLDGAPARRLKWKPHPLAAGYELKIFTKRVPERSLSSTEDQPDIERTLHVDENERVVAPLKDNSFFWTVQAIDEQGLPITTITSPRLERISQQFILGDDGNRRHRSQDVDPRGLKISKVQSTLRETTAQIEVRTPLEGEVLVAGTRDTEYGKLTWTSDGSETRSPAAQSTTNHTRRPKFELQLATDADFVNVLFTKKTTRPEFKLKGDLPEGSLFYRVRQLPKGEWSTVRKFQLVYE